MGEGRSVGVSPGDARKRPGEVLFLAVVVILFVVGVLLFGAAWASYLAAPLRWLIIAALMLAFLCTIGYRVNRRLDGVLIDPRFKISLSRLQISLWTVLVLSVFLTIALPRSMPGGMYDLATERDPAVLEALRRLSPGKEICFPGASTEESAGEATDAVECTPDPVRITFPVELIAALGISVASFAGSTLVQSVKRAKRAEIQAVKDVQSRQLAVDEAKGALDAAEAEVKTALDDLTEKGRAVSRTEAQLAAMTAAAQPPAATTPPGEGGSSAPPSGGGTPAPDPGTSAPASSTASPAAPSAEQLQSTLQVLRARREEAYKALIRAQEKKTEAQDRYNRLVQELQIARERAEEHTEGLLHRNTEASQASWADLFRGDEIGNYSLIDMSKVQMFFFTIALVFAYAAAVYALLLDTVALKNPLGVDLPAFSASMNGLLAISHAGYLTVKTVDHTAVAG